MIIAYIESPHNRMVLVRIPPDDRTMSAVSVSALRIRCVIRIEHHVYRFYLHHAMILDRV